MKTAAERKRDERDRYKAQGLVRYSKWIKPELINKLDKIIKLANINSTIIK